MKNLMQPMEEKPITWEELKAFVNSIPENQLKDIAHLMYSDDSAAKPLLEPFKTEHDYYYNPDDYEDCGSLEELKELHGDNFKESNYKLGTPKGTPFLWAE